MLSFSSRIILVSSPITFAGKFMLSSDVKLSLVWRHQGQTFRELHTALHHTKNTTESTLQPPWISRFSTTLSQSSKKKNRAEKQSGSSCLSFIYWWIYCCCVFESNSLPWSWSLSLSVNPVANHLASTLEMSHPVKPDQPCLLCSQFSLHILLCTHTNTHTEKHTAQHHRVCCFGWHSRNVV